MDLYRPVGQRELELIEAADWRAFPPRLPEQPIFYPVLDLDYAREIARDWNTRDAASGFVGYVLAFTVDDAFAARYPVQVAGARRHRELWVPADELADFNAHLVGAIRVLERWPAT
ncbi:MAG: ADP-ribosylation/crystallin J1 [Polyangiales bacterium]